MVQRHNYQAAAAVKVSKRRSIVKAKRRRKTVSNQIYLIFLSFMTLITVFLCVQFLRFKAIITQQNMENNQLELQLSQMKSENDALEDGVYLSLDLNALREKAEKNLGMHLPTQDQIVWYEADDSSYIHQYTDVPK